MQTFFQQLAIIYLVGIALLWVYAFYRGRKIVKFLQRRHRTKWEDLGSPKPDYFSTLNYQKWSKFISQKEYLSFNDSMLNSLCEDQRKLEKLTLILTVTFFILFGGIALWYEYGS